MPINILVIDDEKEIVERSMGVLRRADSSSILGHITVYEPPVEDQSIENFDVSQFDIKFDIALIDYQLHTSYTGVLVSAWLWLGLRIPRLSLTSAPYRGKHEYFDGFIIKNEITDNPVSVIEKIVNCMHGYNEKEWLERYHKDLVAQYQTLLTIPEDVGASKLSMISDLLDRFEKILDVQQEAELKRREQFVKPSARFMDEEYEYTMELKRLELKLDGYLKEFEKYDG